MSIKFKFKDGKMIETDTVDGSTKDVNLKKFLADKAPEQAPVIGDAIRMGIQKPDAAFRKHVLGRIKSTIPGATAIERRHNIPKEI